MIHRPLVRTLALTVLLAAAPALHAQEGGWTEALQMRYDGVSGTTLSPDGSLLAWVVREPVMEGEKSEYVSQIWVAATDGSWSLQYTRGETSSDNPAFSPDGRTLAFSSARSGKNQVWLIPVGGGEARQLTDAETGVGRFAWAPDGRRIAFTATDPETEEEKQAKKEKRDVILVDRNFKFAHLYVVTADAADDGTPDAGTRLTEGAFHVNAFDWAPDGRRIVFASQPDPRINTGQMQGDLAVVSSEGGTPTPLVTGAGAEGSPLWSPDGRRIAYVSSGDQPEPIGLGDVYVIQPDGGTPTRLAYTHDRSPNLVAWSRDSRSVYYAESVGTTSQVFALPADGGAPRALTEGQGVHGAAAFAGQADRMAFTWQTSDTPADVYVSPVGRYQPTRISDVHAGVPRPPMGRTVVLDWTSKDGTPVEGLLTYPVEYREGQRVPLILNVHGGPAGVFSQSFTGNPGIYMLQTFAQKGYAILRPNPRGSTGYGKEFRYANFMDWGYGDYEDLLSGVDHVIDMGVAHPDSLLLMGWSYGGYMTSFAVTRTDRFKAASMGAGLPNLVSMVTTTDIQDYLAGHMGGEFWDDYDTYEKHSAIYRIKEVVTPTQVIHGAEDLRVPFTQGQEFYRALDRRGVATEFVVYPRTPHGPREPKLLMDVTGRILAWFDTHLRPGRPRAQ